MSDIWGKRPSPALVISILALFVALGGSAYAASKIGTKNIKNNAITSAKIKKNAVTTAKIKNGAVTGAKVNAATLGTVPSATHASTADSATKATDATNAVNATNFSRYSTSGLKRASVGESITLLTVGPFTFTGKCTDLGGGEYEAAIYATTSQAGSNVYQYQNGGYWENDFNPGEEAQVDYGAASTGSEVAFWSSGYNSYAAESADGATLLEGSGNSAVRAFGADCAFLITAVNNA
jgi:hypothetical protein